MLYRFDAFALFHDLEFPVWKVEVMTDVALIECLEMRFIPVIQFAQNIQYYIRYLPNWPMQSEAVLPIVSNSPHTTYGGSLKSPLCSKDFPKN